MGAPVWSWRVRLHGGLTALHTAVEGLPDRQLRKAICCTEQLSAVDSMSACKWTKRWQSLKRPVTPQGLQILMVGRQKRAVCKRVRKNLRSRRACIRSLRVVTTCLHEAL